MQSTEFKLLRLFYYDLRKYFGGQSGDGRVLSQAINALARTGTILSSYLRNRNRRIVLMGKSTQLQNLLSGYKCNQLSSNFCAYFKIGRAHV